MANENLTHWKKLTNPNYLGAYSLDNGEDIVLTIKNVSREMVTGVGGRQEECTVCHFVEDVKPMILNKTNCKTIEKLLGTPYIQQWSGHTIQIGSEKVSYQGDKVDALRVRPFLPQVQTYTCEECGQVIKNAAKMSPKQVAEYTKKKYGKCLCSECAAKHKAES